MDTDARWQAIIPLLRSAIPAFYTLGDYNRNLRQGPAIWLRCVVDRSITEDAPPQGAIPVIYLPKVSRQELRAAGECPARLQPLIELQFRGKVWHQPNGRDWSVMSFLCGENGGIGLEIAQDRRTEEALLRGLELLAEVDINALRGRRLDADDFDKLAVSDPVRDLLRWMSAPEVFEASSKGNRWESFRNVCRTQFAFDPDKGGAREAGHALAVG